LILNPLVLSVFFYPVLLARSEGQWLLLIKDQRPFWQANKRDRRKRTVPADSGSKVTPVSVKISVKLVDLFFLKNVKGPPLGD
jgi:hypothetical protein